MATYSSSRPPPPFIVCADSLWRAFELTSKEKKEILWVPVFSCVVHSSTHTHPLLYLDPPSAVSFRLTHGCVEYVPPRTLRMHRPGRAALCHPLLTLTVDWAIIASVDLGFLSAQLLQCVIWGQGLGLQLYRPAVLKNNTIKAERERDQTRPQELSGSEWTDASKHSFKTRFEVTLTLTQYNTVIYHSAVYNWKVVRLL